MQFMLCVIVVVVLVAITAPTAATSAPNTTPAVSLAWRWSQLWTDTRNWKGGKLPQAGQTVKFPPSLSAFGGDRCSSPTNCHTGGIVTFPSSAGTVANPNKVQLSILQIPTGKIEFRGATLLQFFPSKAATAAVANVAVWDDHGPTANDFSCANNWVINGTTSNPNFLLPCSEDVAVFSTGSTFLVESPQNIFLNQIAYPALPDGRFTKDPYQFTGSPLSTNLAMCPQPYSKNVGPQYCQAWCVNSCPTLNPDQKAEKQRTLDHLNTVLPFIASALNESQAALAASLVPIQVDGAVVFNLPVTMSASGMSSLITKLEVVLPQSAPFNITLSCTVGSDSASVNCAAVAFVANAKKFELTSKANAPYSMRDGVLSSLFADLVNQFATQIAAQEVVDTVTALQATPWFSLSLVVSNRFVDALGADLNSPATMSFLAQSFGVVDGNVRSPFLFPKSQAFDMSTWTFFVFPSSSEVTLATVTAKLTDTASVLEFPTSSSTLVALFDPEDTLPPFVTTPVVLQINLLNSALYAAIPLSENDKLTVTASIVSLIDAQTSMGADILDIQFDKATSSARRRDSLADTVTLSLTIIEGSSLTTSLSASFFDGFVYGSVVSVGTGETTSSFQAIETTNLATQLAMANSTILTLTPSISSALNSIKANGTTPSNLAVGTFAWVDLTVSDDPTYPFFTNANCLALNGTLSNQAAFQASFKSELVKVLPITASSLVITSTILCGPAVASQTNPDQRSVFTLGLQLTASYLLFGLGQSGVVFPPVVNPAWQLADSVAPLGSKAVRASVQGALRRVTVVSVQAAMSNEVTTLTAELIPPAASSNSQASSALPLIGAAAGGGLVVIAIVVVVVMRRKQGGTPAASKPKRVERSVVAFENPLYADTKTIANDHDNKTAESLYDEPAFMGDSAKDNPVFASQEDLTAHTYDSYNQKQAEDGFSAVASTLKAAASLPSQEEGVYEDEPEQAQAMIAAYKAEEDEPSAELDDGGYLDVTNDQ